VLGGFGYLIGVRFTQQLPSLLQQLVGTVHQLRTEFAGAGVAKLQLDQIEASVVDWLQRNRSEAVGYLTTGAGYFIEFLIAVPTAAVINQAWPAYRAHSSRSGNRLH
jgi:hypothetical protein